jgi:hypothetical protein
MDEDKIIPHFVNQVMLVYPNKNAQYLKSCWCSFYKIFKSQQHNMTYVVLKDDLKICFDYNNKNDYNYYINDLLKKYNLLYGECFDIYGPVIIYSLDRDVTINNMNQL